MDARDIDAAARLFVDGVQMGNVMTTGTYTGLNYAEPGQAIVAVFEGFGRVELTVDRVTVSDGFN
jgi:hypothetical protein